MVTEATKKFRDVFAYGLLGVAALYLLSGLSLLFMSEDEVGPFSQRAALFGHVFTHPLLVLSLLGAVLLAVGFGAASKNAKLIVAAAMAIAATALLFALISWFSGFSSVEAFGGVLGAGKVVSILLGLAQLLMLGLTAFFAYTAFQSLPKAASKTTDTAWSQGGGQPGQGYLPGQGYAPNQGYGQGPGYGPGAAQGGQWQTQQGYVEPQQGYGYQSPAQPTWEQAPAQPTYPQGVQQQGGWEVPQQTQTQPSGFAQNWGRPAEAEAAPEQRPGDATQAPVAYPAEGPQWGAATPSGAHEATPTELAGDGNAEGAPPPPQQPER